MLARLSSLSRAALLLTLAIAAPLRFSALAQGPAAPNSGSKYASGPSTSRFDLYGGYGYFHPVNSDINNFPYQPINPGAVASVAGYFTPHFGLQAEGTFFPHGPNDCVYTAQAGPIARIRFGRLVPFVHALGGGAKIGGPAFQPCTWGWGVTGGVGADYILPGFGDHLALRPIQADFHYSQVDYGPLTGLAGVSGGFGEIYAYRLSGGLVLRLGDMAPPAPVSLTCAAQPITIYPGDPITVTAVADNINPKKPVTYHWASTGGAISGSDSTATIATPGLAAGSYNVTGHAAQGSKPNQLADCSASFTVRDYDPPAITCSANPSSVNPGEASTITSAGTSPQNRPLTYSYSASSGHVTGTTNAATLSTADAAPGTVTVTCTAVDDLGKQASATTTVNIVAPVVPPAPQAQALCTLSFERDRKRPLRVDNESKACLDDIALTLQRTITSHLVIIGNHSPDEKPEDAAERTLNVRQYLVDEKGIDPSRIAMRTGDGGTRTVQNSVVPAGATFDGSGTAVDPATIHRHGQPYGKPRRGTR